MCFSDEVLPAPKILTIGAKYKHRNFNGLYLDYGTSTSTIISPRWTLRIEGLAHKTKVVRIRSRAQMILLITCANF